MGSCLDELAVQWWLQKLSPGCDKTDFIDRAVFGRGIDSSGFMLHASGTRHTPVSCSRQCLLEARPHIRAMALVLGKRAINSCKKEFPTGKVLHIPGARGTIGSQTRSAYSGSSRVPTPLFWLSLHKDLVFFCWLPSPVFPLSLRLREEFVEEKMLRGRIFSIRGS